MSGLTFHALRAANMARLPQFRDRQGRLAHSQPDGSDWSRAEWLQAAVGEMGELANVMKKVRRGDLTEAEALPQIRQEISDVLIYLDLLAYQYRIDLGAAVCETFDNVSRRVGADVFLGPSTPGTAIEEGEWWWEDGEPETGAHSPTDAINSLGLEPGAHVVALARGVSLPTVYAAVTIYTDDEMAARGSDELSEIALFLVEAEAEAHAQARRAELAALAAVSPSDA